MLKKTLLFVLLPLGLLTLVGYYWLGGFNDITIELVETPARPVLGKPYRGKYGDLALREIFVRARQLQASDTVSGTLVVVNLDSASAGGKQVNQFIGVALDQPPRIMPNGYRLDTLVAGTYLRAYVQAHPLVMPQPETINQQLTEYANAHQLTVRGLPIEFYRASDTLWVEMSIRRANN